MTTSNITVGRALELAASAKIEGRDHPDMSGALFDLLQDIQRGIDPQGSGTVDYAAWALARYYDPDLTGDDYAAFQDQDGDEE